MELELYDRIIKDIRSRYSIYCKENDIYYFNYHSDILCIKGIYRDKVDSGFMYYILGEEEINNIRDIMIRYNVNNYYELDIIVDNNYEGELLLYTQKIYDNNIYVIADYINPISLLYSSLLENYRDIIEY